MIHLALVALIATSLIFGVAYGAEQTKVIPIGESLALKKTILNFSAPIDNKLPWGYVSGHVTNHATGYPVIIQIYSENSPVHFAQTSVSKDGTYEYKFRVRNVDNDNVINIFEGEYSVIVSKVVNIHIGDRI
ncbi:MAG: hypothetical protein K8823_1434 [Cenarchaeum symbiont of Oopsacas minuta]|nr:hypothetical protein [Cenarchaeum symbiont of Oopsacas minuta]